ncbi:right-handed parallel beta-helix repeat-containing protein [Neobacillus sp. KR4-4]|uniref:right-handed parallel beta-helix repeat-containing protein n=1 Tax=Neobacillus sp. KR4-4 TaxID=3344872 RepID=UPI0035C9AC3D
MKRRNFLVNFIIWFLSFAFGYKVGNAERLDKIIEEKDGWSNSENINELLAEKANKVDIATVLTIYVSTTGNDKNNGLSKSAPLQTVQRAFDTIKNNYSVIDGKIIVDLEAGKYEQSASISNVISKNRIEIIGKKDANGIPTVKFDGGRKENLPYALSFSDYMSVTVQDIKVQNFANSLGRSGIVAQTYTNLWAKNVHVENCGFAGINMDIFTRLYVEGGIIENCRVGIRIYSNSVCTIGFNNPTQSYKDPNHTIIKNCTETGVLLYNMSTGHLDYSELDGNRVGLTIQNSSRLHVMKNWIINSKVVGVNVTASSTWYNDDNLYENNVQDIKQVAFSTEISQSEDYTPILKVHPTTFIDKVTHKGVLGEVSFNTINKNLIHDLKGDSFVQKGQKLKVTINGFFQGGGTKTVSLRLGNGLITSFTSVNDSNKNFVFETDLYAVDDIYVKAIGKWTEGNVAFNTLYSNLKTSSRRKKQTLTVTGELFNKKGSIVIESFEVREIA